jgi:hypothetical protein
MLKPTYYIPALPPEAEIETVPVLTALARANRALENLKGRAKTIANQHPPKFMQPDRHHNEVCKKVNPP